MNKDKRQSWGWVAGDVKALGREEGVGGWDGRGAGVEWHLGRA